MTASEVTPAEARHRRKRLSRITGWLIVILSIYGSLAYLVLPALWTHYEHQRRLADLPMVTRTAQGIPGDAINIGMIGSREDITCAMRAANWSTAAPLSLRTSIGIAGSVIFRRPYRDAPVSSLYYLGRREDMAFEKQVGASADQRHHVRLWKVLDHGEEGRPVWLGAATFDRGVGISRYTGAITHHIAPDIDAERQLLATDLDRARMVTTSYQVTGVGPTLSGRNGEGDPYYTDGEVWILRLVAACQPNAQPVTQLPSPLATQIKDQLWHAIAGALGN